MPLSDLSGRVALGIDIGGTNTKFGVVNHRGQVLEKGSIKTDDFNAVEKAFLNFLKKTAA